MRYSTGYVRKQRGRFIGAWYVNGKRTSKTLGLVKDLTKSEAREKLAELIKASKEATETTLFGPFVQGPFFDFYSRKWKHSTADKNVNRVNVHLVATFGRRDLSSLRRDELQDLLDAKAKEFSFSLVNHIRWDLKQIFDMAVAEGLIRLNPAILLYTPKQAARPTRMVLNVLQVSQVLSALSVRERLIAKLAILAGMRPGEIFALRWSDIGETFAEVRQRVYEGVLDTPKSDRGHRKAALPEGVRTALAEWGDVAQAKDSELFVFPSERGTPLSKHNVWRRNMQPRLKQVGLEWCNFQVMRRTFLSLCKANGGDPKVAADQAGHDIGVSLREYVQTPLDAKLALVNELENLLQSRSNSVQNFA
jgi:integrase